MRAPDSRVSNPTGLHRRRIAPRRVDRRRELLIEWSQDCAHCNGNSTRWRGTPCRRVRLEQFARLASICWVEGRCDPRCGGCRAAVAHSWRVPATGARNPPQLRRPTCISLPDAGNTAGQASVAVVLAAMSSRQQLVGASGTSSVSTIAPRVKPRSTPEFHTEGPRSGPRLGTDS